MFPIVNRKKKMMLAVDENSGSEHIEDRMLSVCVQSNGSVVAGEGLIASG